MPIRRPAAERRARPSWLVGAAAAAIAASAALVGLGVAEASIPPHGATGLAAAPHLASINRRQPPDGKQLYATTCAACHQLDGTGLTDVYPPLAESEWVTGSEERLIKVVLHGVTGEIEVGGEIFSGLMPAWGPSLDDAQIAAVLTYVRKSWGNSASPVAPATVARVRKATAARTSPWTAKDLPATPPPG